MGVIDVVLDMGYICISRTLSYVRIKLHVASRQCSVTLDSALPKYEFAIIAVSILVCETTPKHQHSVPPRSIAEWFDEDGVLLADKFNTDFEKLHSELSVTKKEN